MNKIEIENSLREKFNNEYAIRILTNFIEEFQMCWGDKFPTDKLIDRLKNNLENAIEVVDTLDKNLDAKFVKSQKKIYILKSLTEREEECSYVLFHELLHVITSRDYDEHDDKTSVMGFLNITNGIGRGLDEAMTEYMTQKRNEKLGLEKGKYISGYRTIVEQIAHLAQIVGEDVLIDYYFNKSYLLPELLEQNNMNYQEIEEAFYVLMGKDTDVYNLGNARRIEDHRNFNLKIQAQKLFNNFCNAIGEVTSIEDFKRKYSILNNYDCKEVNLNNIMRYDYYMTINEDIENMMKNSCSKEEIKTALEDVGIDIEECKKHWKFRGVFDDDRNKMAINLSNCIREDYQSYVEFGYNNYTELFERFSEGLFVPGESLYDIYKYPVIGDFLKEHPEYDYDELKTIRFSIEPRMSLYVFTASDGEVFLVSAGYKGNVLKLSNEEFIVNYDKEGKQYFRFHFDGQSFSANYTGEGEFKISVDYAEQSLLDDLEYLFNQDGDKNIKKKIDGIRKRIEGRRGLDAR